MKHDALLTTAKTATGDGYRAPPNGQVVRLERTGIPLPYGEAM
jgi:hypothetical protein